MEKPENVEQFVDLDSVKKWLEENEGKVEIMQRNVVSINHDTGLRFFIWYREARRGSRRV